MTNYQRETIQYSLEEEKKILNTLKRDYKEAGKTIENRIKNLLKREDAELIHVIHQVNYQKALKSQIDDVLDKLNDGTYSSILKYMEDSYGTGFTSSLYRLQKQGVPLIFPMNRDEILRAVQTNSKISKRKYGKNFTKMKNTIRKEVTRGISTSMSFGDMARNIDNTMQSGLYNSYRVARTEGHRINQEASFDAMTKAKEAGADVVKKWDSTIDGRTRVSHRSLEGQVRELEEPFEVAGKKAMYPSGFGLPSEDINCRCVVLEIGRWELDEDEGFTKNVDGKIVSFANVQDYNEFRKKYYSEAEKIKREIADVRKPEQPKLKYRKNYDNSIGTKLGTELYDDMHYKVENCPSQNLSNVWKRFEDEITVVRTNASGAYCEAASAKIHVGIDQLRNGRTSRGILWTERNQTLFHEGGHGIDTLIEELMLGSRSRYRYSGSYKDGLFPKTIVDEVNERVNDIAKKMKAEFKDNADNLDWLYENAFISKYEYENGIPEWRLRYLKYDKSKAYAKLEKEVRAMGIDYYANLSDILEGATRGKIDIGVGHGKAYWTDRMGDGINYGVGMEAFAEMIDATFSNPKQLEAIKRYLPKSYGLFEEMIGEVAKVIGG